MDSDGSFDKFVSCEFLHDSFCEVCYILIYLRPAICYKEWMKYDFNKLEDALFCLREHYPYVILGQTFVLNDITDKLAPILGEDAFHYNAEGKEAYTVSTSLRWGWMWCADSDSTNQFIIAFEDANAFVLARLAGAFDGIKIKEYK